MSVVLVGDKEHWVDVYGYERLCYKMVEMKYTAYKDAGSDGNKISGNAI